MVAKIAGFRTRSQLSLRSPRSISRNITPGSGGVVVHYGGPRQSLGSHAQCENIWRSFQRFHMDDRGWADVAYTAAFCNHGYVLAGRGYGVRTAANGTNAGNQNYYAFCWIGGDGNPLTQDAVNALEWLVNDARRNGAGRRVRPHRDFTGSACPGNTLLNHARRLDNSNIDTGGGGSSPSTKEAELNNEERAILDRIALRSEQSNAALGRMEAGSSPALNHLANAVAKYRVKDTTSDGDITLQSAWRRTLRLVEAVLESSTSVDTRQLARSLGVSNSDSIESVVNEYLESERAEDAAEEEEAS